MNTDMEIDIGSIVQVIDISGLEPRDLQIDEEDFQELVLKIANGDTGVVFDFVDEDENFVDVIFDDGFEVFGISKFRLLVVEDDEYDILLEL
jgi:hypothetical protein